MDTKVNLKLWVKVKKDWRDSDFLIKILDTIRTKFKPLPIFNVYKVFHNANPICIQMAGGKNDGENLEHFWETGRIDDYLEICREKRVTESRK